MTTNRYGISSSRGSIQGRPYVVLDNKTRPGKIVSAHLTAADAQKAADRLNRRCPVCRLTNGQHRTPDCLGDRRGGVYYGEDD